MKNSIASLFLKLICTCFFLGLMVTHSSATEALPEIELTIPEEQVYRDYLGLDGAPGETFKLTDIKADILVIELFSMYCPYCQEEAPKVNELFERLQELEDHRNIVVRIIGIGASNSALEVEHFKATYQVKFPMFPDQDLAKYDLLKGDGTPTFVCSTLIADGGSEIILRQSGGFDSAAQFMNDLLIKGGY